MIALLVCFSSAALASDLHYIKAIDMIHWINNSTNNYKIENGQYYYMEKNADRLRTSYKKPLTRIRTHLNLKTETQSDLASFTGQKKDELCGLLFVEFSTEFFIWLEKSKRYDIGLFDIDDADETIVDKRLDIQEDDEIILHGFKLVTLTPSKNHMGHAPKETIALKNKWTALQSCSVSYNDTLLMIQDYINGEVFDSYLKRKCAAFAGIIPDVEDRNCYFQKQIPTSKGSVTLGEVASSVLDLINQDLAQTHIVKD
jgi:hypothetical protein